MSPVPSTTLTARNIHDLTLVLARLTQKYAVMWKGSSIATKPIVIPA